MVRAVKIYLHANFLASSSKIEQVMVNFVFFTFQVFWLRAVKIYLHAKFRSYGSKIERVMLNFGFYVFLNVFTFFCCWWSRPTCMQNFGLLAKNWASYDQFCVFYIFTFFGCGHLKSTYLQNFGLLAQKLDELCSISFSVPIRAKPIPSCDQPICRDRHFIGNPTENGEFTNPKGRNWIIPSWNGSQLQLSEENFIFKK